MYELDGISWLIMFLRQRPLGRGRKTKETCFKLKEMVSMNHMNIIFPKPKAFLPVVFPLKKLTIY